MVVSHHLPLVFLVSTLPCLSLPPLSFSRKFWSIYSVCTPVRLETYIFICVNAEAFIRLTDPGWIDYCVSCSSIITPLVYDETTPHPLIRWNAGLHQTRSLLRGYGHSPLSTAQLLGSMDLPQFDFTFLFFTLSRSLNGAASALGLVSVFIAIPTLLLSLRASSLSSFVFCVIIRHLYPPTMCMQKSLHFPLLPVVFAITVTRQ